MKGCAHELCLFIGTGRGWSGDRPGRGMRGAGDFFRRGRGGICADRDNGDGGKC
jgi:hypothetical protein